MKLQDTLQEYLLSCQANSLRDATIKWYRSVISAFVAEFSHLDVTDITTSMIRQYIVHLRSRTARYIDAPQKPVQAGGLSPESVASHIRALHAFWAWCAKEYELPNPMRNIKRPPKSNPKPKGIAPDNFIQLLSVTGDDDAGRRDRAILAFLADTGCRLGGLVSLTTDQLSLSLRQAFVIEKGDHTRRVYFTTFTARLLGQWLAVRQSNSAHVFVSMTTAHALTSAGVYQMIERLKKRAGIVGQVNPHSFRHGFARDYIMNGGDIATLAKLLGHADISTTAAYYTIFSQDELGDFHQRFTPIGRLNVGGSRPENS
jgi:integrase/recombinase XerD